MRKFQKMEVKSRNHALRRNKAGKKLRYGALGAPEKIWSATVHYNPVGFRHVFFVEIGIPRI